MSEKFSQSANKPHAGMKAMERAAEEILAPKFAQRDKADAENARFDAIEARKLSPEVQALNDKAELELFGSRGRTYVDSKTGETIATSEKPLVGKFDSILTDVKYGATYKERKEYSERSQNHLAYLLEQGLELSQAKLVLEMDDIQEDQKRFGKQVGILVADGVAPEEAARQVMEKMMKISELRLKRVLEGGVFTKEDYNAVKTGKDLYPDGKFVSSPAAPKDPTTPDPDKAPVSPAQQAAAEAAKKKIEELKALPLDERKKLFATVYGEDALKALSRPEGLMEISDEELLGLYEKAEHSKANKSKWDEDDAYSKAMEDEGLAKLEQQRIQKENETRMRIEAAALMAFRKVSKNNDQLKELLKAAYGDDVYSGKNLRWNNRRGFDWKSYRNASDEDAIAIVFDAINNDYKVEGLTKEDVASVRVHYTPEVTAESKTDEDALLKAIKDTYKAGDVVSHRDGISAVFHSIDEDNKLVRIYFPSDDPTKPPRSPIELSYEDFLNDQKTGEVSDSEPVQDGETLSEDYQHLLDTYRDIAKNDTVKLRKILIAAYKDDKKKAKKITIENARELSDENAIAIMRKARDNGFDIDGTNIEEGRFRGALNRLKNITEKGKKLTRREKVSYVAGALMTGMTVATSAWLMSRHGVDGETVKTIAGSVKDSLKYSVGPMGAPGAMKEALLANSWNIPYGGGLLRSLQEHGIDAGKLTSDVAQNLVDKYPTEFEWHSYSDGTQDIWVSNPGKLSADASQYLNSIK